MMAYSIWHVFQCSIILYKFELFYNPRLNPQFYLFSAIFMQVVEMKGVCFSLLDAAVGTNIIECVDKATMTASFKQVVSKSEHLFSEIFIL
jgi:hypothetical protein